MRFSIARFAALGQNSFKIIKYAQVITNCMCTYNIYTCNINMRFDVHSWTLVRLVSCWLFSLFAPATTSWCCCSSSITHRPQLCVHMQILKYGAIVKCSEIKIKYTRKRDDDGARKICKQGKNFQLLWYIEMLYLQDSRT